MGSALEWALALLRTPGNRHALRKRPLPTGIDHLLGIAAGAMPEVLAQAARTHGEPEARLQEAARFYVREILFFPEADAYRVLGVDAGATAERIKAHHRLLQHWLHPDRIESSDDSIFAARVNVAWNHLRNDARRRAYDETRTRDAAADVHASPAPVLPAWDAGAYGAAPHASPWRQRWPALLLGVACVGLVTLAVLDADREPLAWSEGRDAAPQPAAQTVAALPFEVLRQPVAANERSAPVIAVPAPKALPQRGEPLQHAPEPMPVSVAAAPIIEVPPPQAAPLPAPAVRVANALPPPAVQVEKAVAPPAAAKPAAPPALAASGSPAPTRTPTRAAAQPQAETPVASPVAGPLPSGERIRSAQAVGAALLDYMADARRRPPPVWNSLAIQQSAERMRDDLQQQGQVRVAAPNWRIGTERASFTVQYGPGNGDNRVGSLGADLAWRDGQWLVTGMSMEHAR